MKSTTVTRFQKTSIAATVATFFLIGVGGFVRTAGAGLGCPDWPRCFDRWVPPTDVSQLPAYIDPAQFNFTLAWIEYTNRLVGVTVGLLILAVAVTAWQGHRRERQIMWPALACVALVAFQGWLGGQVVAYELDPRFVTVHLILALVLCGLLLHLVVAGFDVAGDDLPRPAASHVWPWVMSLATLGIALLQTVLGALVRGSLEIVMHDQPELPRASLLDHVGSLDEVHKAAAVLLLLATAALFTSARLRLDDQPFLRRCAQVPVWIASVQFVAGLGLASQGLPPALQLVHLVGASLLFGSLILTALLLAPRRRLT